jgi:hypothetical protein
MKVMAALIRGLSNIAFIFSISTFFAAMAAAVAPFVRIAATSCAAYLSMWSGIILLK